MSSAKDFPEAAIRDSQAILPVENADAVTVATPAPRPHERKLATIRRISSLERLTKRFGLATVDGWKVLILNEENFLVGELVVFCEVDSFTPHRNPYSKLFAPWGTLQTMYGEKGWRIATQQLEFRSGSEKVKVTSQGRIFKLNDIGTIVREFRALKLKAASTDHTSFEDYLRGVDFSEKLGIKKWEPESSSSAKVTASANVTTSTPVHRPSAPVATSASVKASAATIAAALVAASMAPVQAAATMLNPKPPAFMLSTKMERHQNCPNLFNKPKYRRLVYQQTVKLDGSAMSIYFVNKDSHLYHSLPLLNSRVAPFYRKTCVFENGRAGICSTNKDIIYSTEPCEAFVNTAVGLGLPKLLAKLDLNIAFQGELVGHNICGNPYGYAAPNDKANGKIGDCGNGFDFFLHSIVDLHTGKKWKPKAVCEFAAQHQIRHVPLEGYVRIREIANSHDELQAMTEAAPGEGFVFKCFEDQRSFKVLSTKWILEKGDEALARGERLRDRTAPVEQPHSILRIGGTQSGEVRLPAPVTSAAVKAKQIAVANAVAPLPATSAHVLKPEEKKLASEPIPHAAPKTSDATKPVIVAPTVQARAVRAQAIQAPAVKAPAVTAPAINVTVPAEDAVKRARNDELWAELTPGMQLFEAWASGNDYQNIIDYVNAWKAKHVADQAFNEICQKKKAAQDKIADEQKQRAMLRKFAKEQQEKAPANEAWHQTLAISNDIPTPEPSFNLDCAAEESDSEVSGVDEDPGTDVVAPESTTTVMAPSVSITMSPKRAPVKKTVTVSKETLSWLGF
ncbi:hypothetical protein QC763_301190 [Podospora pseudopauciseta]|uniref:RNA ligase domain-containing protein n=1 Tax=Podospora pseudopauciseta TaxID=2093780 RepID=A0ABR0HFA7_9PEZI|nr:hypothetical protein QC763_301190 [Podospora pseudopauciseta]